MESLGHLLSVVYEVFTMPLNIFGITFSFMQVLMYSAIAGMVLKLIWSVLE